MKNGKFNLGWYAFAGVMGMLAGGCFSRAQYHKGQADAYTKITEDLEKINTEVEEKLHEKEESK